MKFALIPEYLKRFKCTGTHCTDNCCHDWNIAVDRTTYFKRKGIKDDLLQSMFVKYCKANPLSVNDMDYALLECDLNGKCYFQTENGLCLIHQRIGPKYLSLTCHTYPRIFRSVNGRCEITGALSCIEIAKILLPNPNKLKFIPIALPKIIDRGIPYYQIYEPAAWSGKWQYYSLQLRDFFIRVIQERSCKLTDRLIFLGLFTQKIQDSIRENHIQQIPVLMDRYLGMFRQGAANNLSANFECKTQLQYKVLQEICQLNPESLLYERSFMEISKIILVPGQTGEGIKNYQGAYLRYYQKFFRDREYFFENFLVDYMFKNIFPYSKDESFFDSYVKLIIHYALLRFHIIISCGFYHEINDSLVVQTIQKVSKSFGHSKEFLLRLYQTLESNAFLSLAHMVILFLDP